jgi:hypothetical protein
MAGDYVFGFNNAYSLQSFLFVHCIMNRRASYGDDQDIGRGYCLPFFLMK